MKQKKKLTNAEMALGSLAMQGITGKHTNHWTPEDGGSLPRETPPKIATVKVDNEPKPAITRNDRGQ